MYLIIIRHMKIENNRTLAPKSKCNFYMKYIKLLELKKFQLFC